MRVGCLSFSAGMPISCRKGGLYAYAAASKSSSCSGGSCPSGQLRTQSPSKATVPSALVSMPRPCRFPSRKRPSYLAAPAPGQCQGSARGAPGQRPCSGAQKETRGLREGAHVESQGVNGKPWRGSTRRSQHGDRRSSVPSSPASIALNPADAFSACILRVCVLLRALAHACETLTLTRRRM